MFKTIEEEWRDIAGYEGIYQISNLGRVKSMNYYGKSGCEKIRMMRVNKFGYIDIVLSKKGVNKTYQVHRLVAEAFIPNPNSLPQVNHIDEDKGNNSVSNLEWCDSSYNINYGNRNKIAGYKNSIPEITPVMCIETGETYISVAEASRKKNIGRGSISLCIKGKQRTAGGYHWKKHNLV